MPNFWHLSFFIWISNCFLYCASFSFYILSSYTCCFILCSSVNLFTSIAYLPDFILFFSLSKACSLSSFYLLSRAFLTSSCNFAYASSFVKFDSSCIPVTTSTSSKSESYLWSYIHFKALSLLLSLSSSAFSLTFLECPNDWISALNPALTRELISGNCCPCGACPPSFNHPYRAASYPSCPEIQSSRVETSLEAVFLIAA